MFPNYYYMSSNCYINRGLHASKIIYSTRQSENSLNLLSGNIEIFVRVLSLFYLYKEIKV